MLDEGRLHDMLQNELVAPLRQTAEMVAQSFGTTLNSQTKSDQSVDVNNDLNFANVTMNRRRKPEADDEEAKQLLHDISASLKRSKITADAERDERNSNYLRVLIGTSCVGIFLSFKEWDDNGVDLRTRTAQCLVPFSFLTEFLVDNMGTVELVSLVPNLRILLKVVRMEKVKQFIESGEEIDPISQAVKPVLLLAAEYSEWGIVSAIFDRKIAFNSIDKLKFSRKILTYICQSCSTPLVKSFIHSPINMGLNFTEAILLAYESQRPDVIDFILSLDLHFDVRLYDFRLAIEVAVSYLDVEFLKFLHERGVEGTRLVHSVETDEVQNFLQACFDLATIPVPEEEVVFPYDSSTVLVSFIPACIEGLIRHSRSPLTCINLLMKEPAFEIDDANLQINVLPQPSFAYLFAELMRHPLYDATILKRLLQLWVATKHASRRVEEEREDLLNFCKVIEDVVVALFACDATNREENLLPLIRMEKLDDSDDLLHSLEVGHLSDHLNQQRIIRIRRQTARTQGGNTAQPTRKKLTGRRLLQASSAEKLQAHDMRWIFGEESFIKLALDKKFKVAFGIPQINRLILLIFDSGRFEHQESYFQERFFPQILFYIDMLMRIITFVLIASIAIAEYPTKMRLSYSAPTKYVPFSGTEVFLALFLFAEIIHEIGEVLELRRELVIRDRTTGVKVARGQGSGGSSSSGGGGGGGWMRRGRAATLLSSTSMSSTSLSSSMSFDDGSTVVGHGHRRHSDGGGDEDENGHHKDGGGDLDEELLLYDGDDVASGRRSFSAVDGLRDLSQSLQEHLPLSFTEPSALASSKPPTSPTAAAAGSASLSHNATALLAAASAGPPLPPSSPTAPSSEALRSPTSPTGTPASPSPAPSSPPPPSSSYYAPPSRPRHHHRRQRRLRRKRELFQAYFRDDWNIVDVLNSTGGLVWFVLRCIPSQFIAARVTLSLLAIPWSIGLLRFFSVNKTLGELVIIIRAMLQDLTAFVSVYIVMIAGFGVAFRGLFADTTAYATMPDTFLALFSGTLSNFSFESFETGNRGVNSLGILLTLVFVVMTAILLINLLIAKMSTSFQRVSDKSQMEWAFERAKLVRSLTLIREKEVWNILPAPLNLIPIVVTCGGVADYNVFQRRTLLGYQRQWLSIPARWLLPAASESTEGEGGGEEGGEGGGGGGGSDATSDTTTTRAGPATRTAPGTATAARSTASSERHPSPDDDAANAADHDDGYFLLSIRGTVANITLFFVYFPLAKILEVCLAFAYAFVLLGRDESGTHPPGSLLNLSPTEFVVFFAQTVFYLVIYVPLFVVEMLRSLTKAEWMLRPWVSYLHDVDQHLVSYTEKFLLVEAAYVRQRYEAAALASAAVAAATGAAASSSSSPSSPSSPSAAASDDAAGANGDDDHASPLSSGSRSSSKKRQSLPRRRQLPGRKRSAYDATPGGGGGGTGLTSSSFFTRSAYSLVKDTYALYPPGWDGTPFLDDALDDGDEATGGGGAGGDDGNSVGGGGGGSVGGASMASGSAAAARQLRGGRRMSREFSLRRRVGDGDARDDDLDDDLDGDLDADEDEVYHQHKRRHLSYRNRYRQLQQQLQQQQQQQQLQQQQGRPLSMDRRSDSTGNAAVVASISGGARDSASMDDASYAAEGAGAAAGGVGAAMGGANAAAAADADGDIVTLTRIFRDEDIDVILRPFACSSANSSAMSGGYGSGAGGGGGAGGAGAGAGGGGGATMPAAMAVNQQVMLLLLEEHNDRVQALQAALATALAEQRQLRVVNHEMHTMLRTLLPTAAPLTLPTTAAVPGAGAASTVSDVPAAAAAAAAATTTMTPSMSSNATSASPGSGNGNTAASSTLLTPATVPASQPPALTTPVDSESVYAHPLMSTLERMGASLRQLGPAEPAANGGGPSTGVGPSAGDNPIDFSFLRPRAMSLKLAARLSNVHTHATGFAAAAAATAAAVSSAAAATSSAAAAASAAFGGVGSSGSSSAAAPMPPLHGRSRPPMPPPPKPLRRPRQPPTGGAGDASSPPPLGHPPHRK